uniref:Uncharacterized protein n=1 Tax=Arundo donax TaxID=35708 RepID=A0A0A9G6J4_ARUDO
MRYRRRRRRRSG